MSGHAVQACPVCGSGNAPNAGRCWICGVMLSPAIGPYRGAGADPAAHPPRAAAPAPAAQTHPAAIVAWIAVLLGIFAVTGLIAIELAINWPGVLVPYALMVLIVYLGLGRVAWISLSPPRPPGGGSPAVPPGASTHSSKGEAVIRGVAWAMVVAAIAISLAFLLFVAAMVIFFVICLAAMH